MIEISNEEGASETLHYLALNEEYASKRLHVMKKMECD